MRDPVMSSKIGAAVLRSADKYFQNSLIVDPDKFASVPRLGHNDVEIGKFLGQGSFGNVYNVIRVSKKKKNNAEGEETHEQQEQECRYALKCLNPATTSLDVRSLFTGAADLACEAKLLSSLNHRNIVKIHAIGNCYTPTSFVLDEKYGVFYILDRIEMTLSEKIEQWNQSTPMRLVRSSFLWGCSASSPQLLSKRLDVASQIASALHYLHSLNLMHRDIKPENMGFDIHGTVKIFDFGTAKEIISSSSPQKNPTGLTGTIRYMAPEVALSKYYDLSADVYSFGLLLWELCSLKVPFKKYNEKMYMERVVHGKERPRLDSMWPISLKRLMRQSWSDDATKRPDFETIFHALQLETSSLRASLTTTALTTTNNDALAPPLLTRHVSMEDSLLTRDNTTSTTNAPDNNDALAPPPLTRSLSSLSGPSYLARANNASLMSTNNDAFAPPPLTRSLSSLSGPSYLTRANASLTSTNNDALVPPPLTRHVSMDESLPRPRRSFLGKKLKRRSFTSNPVSNNDSLAPPPLTRHASMEESLPQSRHSCLGKKANRITTLASSNNNSLAPPSLTRHASMEESGSFVTTSNGASLTTIADDDSDALAPPSLTRHVSMEKSGSYVTTSNGASLTTIADDDDDDDSDALAPPSLTRHVSMENSLSPSRRSCLAKNANSVSSNRHVSAEESSPRSRRSYLTKANSWMHSTTTSSSSSSQSGSAPTSRRLLLMKTNSSMGIGDVLS